MPQLHTFYEWILHFIIKNKSYSTTLFYQQDSHFVSRSLFALVKTCLNKGFMFKKGVKIPHEIRVFNVQCIAIQRYPFWEPSWIYVSSLNWINWCCMCFMQPFQNKLENKTIVSITMFKRDKIHNLKNVCLCFDAFSI